MIHALLLLGAPATAAAQPVEEPPPVVEPVPVEPAPPAIVSPAPPPAPAPIVPAQPPAPMIEPTELPPEPQAPAQRARVHDGFYLRMSLGGGRMHGAVDLGSGVTIDAIGVGPAGGVAIGATATTGFVLGGAIVTNIVEGPRISGSAGAGELAGESRFGIVGAFVDWYPDETGGFHFGAILGFALFELLVDADAQSRGWGGGLEGGYDFWVGQQWSLGGLVRWIGGATTRDVGDGVEEDTVSAFSLCFTALYH